MISSFYFLPLETMKFFKHIPFATESVCLSLLKNIINYLQLPGLYFIILIILLIKTLRVSKAHFKEGRKIFLFFPVLEWTAGDEDQADMHVWEDNWDDDTVEDDFSNQLRYVQIQISEHQ